MMRECPKCNSMQIEEGHQIDKSHGESFVGAFIPGPPDKRWWGYKIDKKAKIPIALYRCKRCGYVESYAK